MKETFSRKDIVTVLCVVIASFLCALNINTFINAGGLFPGGFTGLTVFIQRFFEQFLQIQLPYSLVNFSLNAIPAFIGFKMVGKKFTIYSCLMIFLTGVFVDLIPSTNITEDILLITIFGGILQGIALGIALKGNASSGGTDFIAMWISKKTGQPAWNYILGMNAVMLAAAGYLFGWDKALYSIIFQFCSTQVVNTIHKRYKQMTLFIITSNPNIVVEEIQYSTHHGVTRLDGIGTYYGQPRAMLYTVVDSTSVKRLVTRIREIDPSSFVNVTKTEYVEGRFYQVPIE
ncbi:YitT family protein [[Eubacterium] hominis]|uniref:YitT family protein n=1 Tax=[Eubacterium] hominis TaxID=2764325 RepID=UPI003A4D703D